MEKYGVRKVFFKNKTEDVAQYFRKILHEDGYKQFFDKIVFAIYDNSADKGKIGYIVIVIIP